MGQPVKLSDSLVSDARIVGEAAERSIAGQIEFWARLGRAIEPILRTEAVLKIKQRGEVVPLSACLAEVDTAAGRERVGAYLASRPFPHFKPAPNRPGFVVKIDEDGTRTLGRLVGRKFEKASRR
ncbi:TA system antitoxin ParD family protein [Vulgatibacter sp.]|uniref:TA system antitoxin ParD family protein n=1 Tax=Vulgatibacter sp. TaxID=1971226 RepID=UPI00356154B4